MCRRVIASAVLSLTVTAGAASDLDERLAALERTVQELAAENRALRESFGIPRGAPAAESSRALQMLRVGGFLQGQAEFGGAADPRWAGTRDRFFFRRARIYVAGTMADDFEFKAEIDLQGNTLGAATGNLARANEIFIGWKKIDSAQLRFGQLKPAFGAEALSSDTKMLTIERSLASDRQTDGRQLAVAAAGKSAAGFGYYVVVANGSGSNVSANDNNAFQRSARLTYATSLPAWGKWTAGVNVLQTRDAGVAKAGFGLPGNQFHGEREMSGADFEWQRGRFTISGEYLRGEWDPTNAPTFESAGWQLTGAFMVWTPRLQAVVRAEEFDPNRAIAHDTWRTLTLGVNFYLKGDDLKFQLNYLRGQNDAVAEAADRVVARVQLVY